MKIEGKNVREIECHHQSPTTLVIIIIVTKAPNKEPLDLSLVVH